VQQALERGHRVTAFVRTPQKLGGLREGLTAVHGDPRDAEALARALPGHDAVLSSLGPPGVGPSTIISDCARTTVSAMQAVGTRRLLVVGAAVLFEDMGLVTAIMRGTFLRNVTKDQREMERIVTASDLDWTIARPPRLTNGPLTGRYLAEDGRMPRTGVFHATASMSRADVAHFLLEEVEHAAHVRRVVGVVASSKKPSLAPEPRASA
jgi:putative NADH-flavin reductase